MKRTDDDCANASPSLYPMHFKEMSWILALRHKFSLPTLLSQEGTD